jgi:hypothetical protein
MAYRAPRFSYVHAARDAGAGGITVSDTAHADFPKDNLVDDRAATRFKWSGSVASPTIDIDLGHVLGAGFDTGISRLIIPADHNIESIYIEDDDSDSFSSPAALHASVGSPDTSPVAGTLYDSGAFDTGNSTQRYIRINIVGTAQYYLPQIFLTKIMTLTAGPVLEDTPDFFRPNITQLAHSPFFVDPASFSTPPETDEPALWMRFSERPDSRNSILVPMNGVRSKTFRLSLVESLD